MRFGGGTQVQYNRSGRYLHVFFVVCTTSQILSKIIFYSHVEVSQQIQIVMSTSLFSFLNANIQVSGSAGIASSLAPLRCFKQQWYLTVTYGIILFFPAFERMLLR